MNTPPTSIPETLELARRYHAAGQLQQAEQLYRRILDVQPSHAAATQLLGVIAYQVGQHPQAIELIQRSLEFDASDVAAYNNLGAVQQAVEDYAGAVESYRRAIEIKPDYFDAYSNLGAALLRLGRFAESAEQCRMALELKPDFYPALTNLGGALRGLNQNEEAIASLRQALTIAPKSTDAWRQLALALQSLGRLDEAQECYHRLLSLKPADEQALCSLGTLLRRQRKLDQALATYDQVLAKNGQSVDAMFGRTAVLRDLFRFEDALECLRRILEIKPQSDAAYQNLAVIQRDLGHYDEAIEACRRALEIRPDSADPHNNLSGIYQELGDIPRAIEECHAAIAADPNQAFVYANLASMKRFTAEDETQLHWIQQRLESGEVADHTVYHIHFALGKILDDLGRYDEAFEHYQVANAKAQVDFDEGQTRERFDALREVFTAECFQALAGLGDPTEQPVFIVGMPRSGTTLVEQILSSHDQVCGAGELPYINTYSQYIAYRVDPAMGYPRCMPRLTAPLARDVAGQYLGELARLSAGASRVTDKMPLNFQHLGLIAILFPRARVVHCRRNPLDVCLSCYFANFAARIPFAFNLANLGAFYRMYERLMEHWRGALPIEMLEVDYATLVNQPEPTIRKMIEYCGLPWDSACLEFHNSKRVVRTASNIQVREPIHRRSLDRWKHYEKHLGQLKDALGKA